MKGFFICPACKGNGYRRIIKDNDPKEKAVIDCKACNNQGEIKDNEKIGLRFVICISLHSCSQLALVASGGSLVLSQNSLSKVYSGVDILTVISTEKDIKTHIKNKINEHN